MSYPRTIYAKLCTLLFAVTMTATAASAQVPSGSGAIDYRLSFPDAQHHYVEVQADIPAAGPELVLFLPVWTPGSYMVREYSRHIEGLTATDAAGQACAWNKISKNRWKVDTHGAAQVHLHYRVYCREMTVRSCWVESDFALINGAAVYLSVAGAYQRPYHVEVQLPADWKEALSGMPRVGGHFEAADYDQLLDCPIVAGNPTVHRFQVLGTEHVLVDQGEGGVFDGNRAATDVAKIVTAAHALWGDFPYTHAAPNNYTFFNILTGAGGGLEHKDSTVLMSTRWATRLHKDYLSWLGLVGHEYFHCWNVKRLRPVALGPFDYENEVYTTSLWVAEGFTEYYGELLVRRAGLSTVAEYLEELSHNIKAVEATSGHKLQPLGSSSFDAWIKFYRPDENSPNTGVSYYAKGSVVGFLLDARIRQASNGQKSLDDVMRLGLQRYSGAHGYTEQQFRALASEVAGKSLSEFFTQAVDGVGELDYVNALKFYGLRFKAEKKEGKDGDAGYLGFVWANKNGRLEITGVRRDTPAYMAGLQAEDELIGIDDYRVLPDAIESHEGAVNKFDERLKRYPAGTRVTLLVARREQLLRIPVVLGKKPSETWALELDPAASSEAHHNLELWLGKA